jgi:hypothetical protein
MSICGGWELSESSISSHEEGLRCGMRCRTISKKKLSGQLSSFSAAGEAVDQIIEQYSRMGCTHPKLSIVMFTRRCDQRCPVEAIN